MVTRMLMVMGVERVMGSSEAAAASERPESSTASKRSKGECVVMMKRAWWVGSIGHLFVRCCVQRRRLRCLSSSCSIPDPAISGARVGRTLGVVVVVVACEVGPGPASIDLCHVRLTWE